MSELAAWDSFYVIVGSGAGALVGLQFVVVTLIAERPKLREPTAGAAFRAWETLFAVGAAALLLLFVGIHNAWDSIAYHVFGGSPDTKH